MCTLRVLLLLASAVCLFQPGCRRSTPSSSASPDGTMTMTTTVNRDPSHPARDGCVIVEIRDRSGTSIYREVTPASDHQRWSIRWESNDRIVLDSSDIGRYVISKSSSGHWTGDPRYAATTQPVK